MASMLIDNSRGYLFWLTVGFWLSPFLFAYAFVLTTLRPKSSDWRQGRRLLLTVTVYLIVVVAAHT
jgi:hypothetical protein